MVLREIDESEYAAFLESRPLYSVFHKPAWLRAVQTAYGVNCFLLGLFDGARLVGGLPVQVLGCPFLWVSVAASGNSDCTAAHRPSGQRR